VPPGSLVEVVVEPVGEGSSVVDVVERGAVVDVVGRVVVVVGTGLVTGVRAGTVVVLVAGSRT
jgi:hypothetical protein